VSSVTVPSVTVLSRQTVHEQIVFLEENLPSFVCLVKMHNTANHENGFNRIAWGS